MATRHGAALVLLLAFIQFGGAPALAATGQPPSGGNVGLPKSRITRRTRYRT